MTESIKFLATLAGVNTAARPASFGIDGDAKISLETDETQVGQVVALLALGKSLLEIEVRVVPGAVVPEKKPKRGKKPEAAVDTETGAVAG